jgi:hypothetical protein
VSKREVLQRPVVKAFDLVLMASDLVAEKASNLVARASSLVAKPHASSALGLPSRRSFCNRAPESRTLATPLTSLENAKHQACGHARLMCEWSNSREVVAGLVLSNALLCSGLSTKVAGHKWCGLDAVRRVKTHQSFS